MTENINYKTLLHTIRCAVLRRKLQALQRKEGATDALVAELAWVYGLHAKKTRGTHRRYWKLSFNPAGRRAADDEANIPPPGADIARAVLRTASLGQ